MPEPWRFLASHWVRAWAENWLPNGRWRPPCRYVTVRDQTGVVRGVLPWATMQFGPVRFCAVGGYFLPYRSLALDSTAMEATCDALASALACFARFRAGLRLGPVAAVDPMSGSLAAALKRRGWQVGRRVLGASFLVRLPQSLSEFNQTCRGVIKRAAYHERRLRRSGVVEIKRFNGLADWPQVIDDVASIESNSWIPKNNGYAHFNTSKAKKFWLNLLKEDYLSSIVSISIIYFDGRPITFSANMDVGQTKYIIANLYDETFRTHSCGTVLAHHVLRDAIENGQEIVDWGQGDPGYKQLWSAKPLHAVHDIIAFPPGMTGRFARAMLNGRSGYFF